MIAHYVHHCAVPTEYESVFASVSRSVVRLSDGERSGLGEVIEVWLL